MEDADRFETIGTIIERVLKKARVASRLRDFAERLVLPDEPFSENSVGKGIDRAATEPDDRAELRGETSNAPIPAGANADRRERREPAAIGSNLDTPFRPEPRTVQDVSPKGRETLLRPEMVGDTDTLVRGQTVAIGDHAHNSIGTTRTANNRSGLVGARADDGSACTGVDDKRPRHDSGLNDHRIWRHVARTPTCMGFPGDLAVALNILGPGPVSCVIGSHHPISATVTSSSGPIHRSTSAGRRGSSSTAPRNVAPTS